MENLIYKCNRSANTDIDTYKIIFKFYSFWERWEFIRYLKKNYSYFNDLFIDLRLHYDIPITNSAIDKRKNRRKRGYHRFKDLPESHYFIYSIDIQISLSPSRQSEFYKIFTEYLRKINSKCFTEILDEVTLKNNRLIINTLDEFYAPNYYIYDPYKTTV